jgi:type I restriction enzyme S subunit
MAGIKMPRLRSRDLRVMPIPLAPLSEQRRIVEKIEALFEQSRTARQALDRIPPLLKTFRQAVLAAAFRGDLTRDWREQHTDAESASVMLERIRAERRHESEGPYRGSNHAERKTVDMGDLPGLPPSWVWCTLDQCTNLITKGESPNWQGYQYVAEGVPFVRSENVLWGALDLSGVARVPDTFHQKLQRSKLKPNDVLINLVGASIGRCAIVPSELCEANINQAVATIRTAGTLYPPYLLHLLLSPAMQEVIQGKRVEVARPNISLGDLRNLIIPLAPAAEQERIVFKIEQLFAVVAAIEMAVQVAEQRADLLDRSILTRAFSGELVPQDPNDEPASVLLKRIGTERGMASASKRLRSDGLGKRKHHASKRMARG